MAKKGKRTFKTEQTHITRFFDVQKIFFIWVIIIVILTVSCATLKPIFKPSPEDKDFKKAKQINTIEGYRHFLEKYPDSKYSKDVEFLINELLEQKVVFEYGENDPGSGDVTVYVDNPFDRSLSLFVDGVRYKRLIKPRDATKVFIESGKRILEIKHGKRIIDTITVKVESNKTYIFNVCTANEYYIERAHYSITPFGGPGPEVVRNFVGRHFFEYKADYGLDENFPSTIKVWGVPFATRTKIYRRGMKKLKLSKKYYLEMDEIDYSYNIKPLLNALKYHDPVVRSEAVTTLLKIRDRKDINPDIRQEIVNALKKTIEFLVGALRNTDYNIRKNAAIALGKIGDKSIVPRLIKGLSDSYWERRQGSAWALGYLKDPRVVYPLIKALGDEEGYVREAAAIALGEIGDSQAVEPLINALNDNYLNVCEAAAEALGKIGDSRAVEPLIKTLKTTIYESLRHKVATALSAITGKNFGEDYNAWLKWWNEEGKQLMRK